MNSEQADQIIQQMYVQSMYSEDTLTAAQSAFTMLRVDTELLKALLVVCIVVGLVLMVAVRWDSRGA